MYIWNSSDEFCLLPDSFKKEEREKNEQYFIKILISDAVDTYQVL